MVPKSSAEVLSSVPKSKKAVTCLTGKIRHSGMSYSAAGMSLILMNQHYILNKMSLNKNTYQGSVLIS